MRQLLHALIVAMVAAIVLATAALARPLAPSHAEVVSASQPAPAEAPLESQQRGGLYARVVKPFGASIRAFPSWEASIVQNARCGDVLPVVAVDGGWVKVRMDGRVGWVGGGRVVVSSMPALVDCSTARFIAPGDYVSTSVPTACLTLHSRPSSESSAIACVDHGHRYMVLDGPFDQGGGQDWFKVTSPTTGTGWAPAEQLSPG